ncbi:hypothetical protein ACT17_28415 [Mycolicibacterium conceptionense]|uniref:DUF2637 domain-containing protein n=2 Tax=Mycolicibacterium conceptionense TaxID=451644 RepID=A0A0J8U0P4_9MYCO|nr:hypothetical protein ACT17_28415 [Mycolicibacterium conceptionense]
MLWAILVSATAASMSGNVARALTHLGSAEVRGPIIAAAIPPLALLALTHLIAMWSRVAVRGLVYWCFLLAVAAINAAAFRLSFDALRALAMQYGYGRTDAALFPLILDGLVGVCTLGLVVLARIEHPAAHDADVAQTEAAGSRSQSERTSGDARTAPTAAGDAPAAPVGSHGEAVAAHRAAAVPQGAIRVRQDNDAAAPPRHFVDRPDPHLTRARALVDAKRTSASVDVVHRVLTRTADGGSSREVATEVGISASSVLRIVKAAHAAAE